MTTEHKPTCDHVLEPHTNVCQKCSRDATTIEYLEGGQRGL